MVIPFHLPVSNPNPIPVGSMSESCLGFKINIKIMTKERAIYLDKKINEKIDMYKGSNDPEDVAFYN